jgi:hypothetical protein
VAAKFALTVGNPDEFAFQSAKIIDVYISDFGSLMDETSERVCEKPPIAL